MSWASAVGSLISSAGNYYAAERAWKHQKEYAQNAHQWEVEDLKKAGLNPILSAGGSGAPMTTAPMAQFDNPLSGYTSAKMLKKQTEADTQQKDTQSRVNSETAKNIAQSTGQEQELFKFKKDAAMWNAKTAEQNYLNAKEMPAVFRSQVYSNNSSAQAREIETRRGRAEMPFWEGTGEVVNSAVQYGRDVFRKLKESWDKGYQRSNDTSKNQRSGFIAHLDRGGTVANYK